MANKIKVLEVGDLQRGMHVMEPDSGGIAYGGFVPSEAYDPDDQDWHQVVHVGGFVDLPTVTLMMRNGETYTSKQQVEQQVWVLHDADAEPIMAEDD